MKGFGKVGWVATAAGTLVYLLASAVLPLALGRMGVNPRIAAGETLTVLLFVGPVGLVVSGAVGLGCQALNVVGWLGGSVCLGLGSVASGLSWGALAELILWARIRARVLFWALVLGLGGLWLFMLALAFLAG